MIYTSLIALVQASVRTTRLFCNDVLHCRLHLPPESTSINTVVQAAHPDEHCRLLFNITDSKLEFLTPIHTRPDPSLLNGRLQSVMKFFTTKSKSEWMINRASCESRLPSVKCSCWNFAKFQVSKNSVIEFLSSVKIHESNASVAEIKHTNVCWIFLKK